MFNCLTCQTSTSNPKYCSRRCAAISNNKLHPKRKPQYECKVCATSISSAKRYCSSKCRQTGQGMQADSFAELTMQQVKENGTANFNSRYPYIRTHSRKQYLKSDKPKYCVVCKYDKHFDVCHIVDVKDFPPETLIAEINRLSNLVALCKNHHWEFDHGHLQLPSHGA